MSVLNPAEITAAGGAILANLPSRSAAQTKVDEIPLCLPSGACRAVPAGWFSVNLGPFLTLCQWSVQRQAWLPKVLQRSGIHPLLYSTGNNYRVYNLQNCAVAVTGITPGSGYSSATPPVLTTTRTMARKPTFRCDVGGAVAVAISSGGLYDYPPTIEWDVSQQTPPFRTPQVVVHLTAGVITSVEYTGNDYGFPAYSGANLDVATLDYTIVRHPADTQTSDAVLALSAAGEGKVTNVEVTDFGSFVGNFDFIGTNSITHNGGSSFDCSIAGQFYIVGYDITSAGVNYCGGGNSGGAEGYPAVYLNDGILDDEISHPDPATALCIVTSGLVTAVNSNSGGGFYQYRPRATVVPSKTPPTTNAVLTPRLGIGNDQGLLIKYGS